MRAPASLVAVVLALALALVAAGCGPLGPTEQGGDAGDPLAVVTALPSPGELRGPDPATADAADLAEAFTGRPDAELAAVIDERAPADAAVRTWTSPGGGTLTVAASVWPSHLIATGVGSDLAARLVADDGAAWTPPDVPGARRPRRASGSPSGRTPSTCGPPATSATTSRSAPCGA